MYSRWFLGALLIWLLYLPAAALAPLLSFFTARGWPSWGCWLWTYNNPPWGGDDFVITESWFPLQTTGVRGYINRVQWLWRNPLYGLARRLALTVDHKITILLSGNPNISDNKKIAGSYTARAMRGGVPVGWEFYLVKPYSASRCIRIRLGYKLAARSTRKQGFAPLVCVINPVDGYG